MSPRRFRRPILSLILASLVFAITLSIGLMKQDQLTASLMDGRNLVALSGEDMSTDLDPEKEGEWTYCQYTAPAEPTYAVELQSTTVEEDIQAGDTFTVDMTFLNSGDTRLYSDSSGCDEQAILNLGTQKTQDRLSVFGAGSVSVTGWLSSNRIEMSETYVEPGDTFHVVFQSIAPEGDDVYREYFQPVIEGVAWIGEAFSVDIAVGAPTDQMKSDIAYAIDASMAASDLSGLERNVLIDLSDQMMYARFGETTVWSLQISSGAWDTPTPPGTYQILTKQELRIGSKWPHYRMPYFQLWDSRGYGIHALPYLATDGGTFWTEALNHIGRPVSHGCIRTLPDDAAALYQFTLIGTPVVIQR